MYVLGIGGFMHDYNCCLIDIRRQKVSMCEAERLSGRKHHVIRANDDLLQPVEKCCRDLGCRVKDIDQVVFGHTDPFECKIRLKELLGKKEYVEIDHHLCHAAAGFFSSPYDSAVIVSVDGFGDGTSALHAVGKGTRIEEIERISEEDSIGLEYLRATFHIGLGGYGAEGKTQGLAPYGEPILFEDYMNEIEVTPGGNLRLSKRLRHEGSRLSEEGGYLNSQLLTNSFLSGYCSRRISPEELTPTYINLAASIQRVLETVVTKMSLIARQRSGMDCLVLTGGVSMNSSLNGCLLRGGEFRRIFALPMASDRGIGLGAALYQVHHNLGVPRFFSLEHVYYGNASDDRAIVQAVKKANLKYEKRDDIPQLAARALAEGKIVGWFQGRSEMGARALGNRSILADPRRADMKDIVNARVKHREWFRPFAPAVPGKQAAEYFDFPEGVADLSFMTFTVPAKQKAVENAPAVVHVDQTARVQTVDPARNPSYAEVIQAFGNLTGVPIILNTSFNDHNEPIVETPVQAVATFLKTEMDLLCMGNVIARKK